MKYAKEMHRKLEQPAGFRVITVGSGSPPLQDLERTSPCTIVQYRDKYFVVDLGCGAVQDMIKLGIFPGDVENALITHLHADHSLDYGYFLLAGRTRNELRVVGPKGTKKMHENVLDLYGEDLKYRTNLRSRAALGIIENVDIKEVEGGESFEMDGLNVSTLFVPHTAYTVAYKFETGGESVVVSGDLMYHEPFIEFIKGARMVVLDANMANSTFMQSIPPEFVERLYKSHASIPEIAQMAQKAGVPSIVLTHFTRGVYVGEAVQEVSRHYEGEIIVAEDGLAVDLD